MDNHEDTPIGFMIYELFNRRIRLINLSVHQKYRRQKIGTEMIQALISKLTHKKRVLISAEVRESNLSVQLFLKKQGFVAVKIAKNFFQNTGEDAYIFHYNIDKKPMWH